MLRFANGKSEMPVAVMFNQRPDEECLVGEAAIRQSRIDKTATLEKDIKRKVTSVDERTLSEY